MYNLVASGLNLFGPKILNAAAKVYGSVLTNELNRMGLRAEDILIEDAAMKEALDLSDPDIAKGRYRRLLRASDLSFKGKEYQDYGDVAKLRPFKAEVMDLAEKIEAREEEYDLLDIYKK
uniref:Uncharacterized protein n=1 Tax=Entomoneis paludosa TaxID=265537 RepID=A0A7S3DU26_9STRA|mmetsp:Transcript_36748/g.76518  ORF Transcript_36748/g.76518 Transcript_36748/m.76518 type:complete len:120 (+) Transcript_36748:90-449(+)|eukprot:CAMPEP_0172439624 /NCGR_PEP_ID=MMETSP1065-20121228/548_1 /TAXON_ID=265537 /ORGANISM="Amphiprora paludosa, Strain CCMP125" /LENGTH=119 /DNA_ID=CAMNT_0013188333 /DNA_START=50 /DNA_END=409 /DNA_ORIENTATION=+